VTHEHHASEWSEIGGPEQDDKLPDATTIPVSESPEDFDAPPMGAEDSPPVFNSMTPVYDESGDVDRHIPVWVS